MLKSKAFIPVSLDGSTGTQYKTWPTNVKSLSWAEYHILVYLVNSGEIEKCSFLIHDLTCFDIS